MLKTVCHFINCLDFTIVGNIYTVCVCTNMYVEHFFRSRLRTQLNLIGRLEIWKLMELYSFWIKSVQERELGPRNFKNFQKMKAWLPFLLKLNKLIIWYNEKLSFWNFWPNRWLRGGEGGVMGQNPSKMHFYNFNNSFIGFWWNLVEWCETMMNGAIWAISIFRTLQPSREGQWRETSPESDIKWMWRNRMLKICFVFSSGRGFDFIFSKLDKPLGTMENWRRIVLD